MTYSIVALDAGTGELGVGVQTHQLAVGAVVPWVRSGVGAVATQSMSNVNFGRQILDLLQDGLDARNALKAVLASDEQREIRQVAVVDRKGGVAAHTGQDCIPFASHIESEGYSVQANMMLGDIVPKSMKTAFEATTGALPIRIMAALEAAQAAGGDIRGCQSAAIIVMGSGTAADNYRWNLRVDDAPDPLANLRRLIQTRQAGAIISQATRTGSLERVRTAYAEAQRLAPSDEQTFWYAVNTLAVKLGQIDEAAAQLEALFGRVPHWRELLHRLKGPNRCPPLEERFPRR